MYFLVDGDVDYLVRRPLLRRGQSDLGLDQPRGGRIALVASPRGFPKLEKGGACGIRRGARRVGMPRAPDEAHKQIALAFADGDARVAYLSRVANSRALLRFDGESCRLKVGAAALELARVVEEEVEREDRAVGVRG